MAYTFEPGDTVEVEYKNENGEVRSYEATVEFNTTRDDPDEIMGSPKARLYTSKGRSGIEILMHPDGTLRAKPRFNSNGRGENGYLKNLTMVQEADA